MPTNPYLKALAPGASLAGGKSSKRGSKASTSASTSSNTPVKGNKGKGKGKADEQLRAEILALGGDEDDLEMLDGVDSESEVEEGGEEGKGKEAGLMNDLKSFMKGLDFSAAGATAPASSDEEEAADEGAADEGSDEEAVAPVAQEAPAPAPVAAIKAEKKESKHEREERRRVEREAAKEVEREQKEEEREAREEKRKAKAMPATKSPWIVDPTPHWYAVPMLSPSSTASKPSATLIQTLQTRGESLLNKENTLYSSSLDPKASKSSAPPPPNGLSKADQVFIQQILSSGTSSDKISALLLLVSSSPLHNTPYLDQLAALCRKKSRDESGRAVRGVVDWWRGEGGGSPDRKLRYFADQPLLSTVAEAFEQVGRGQAGELQKEDVDRCLVLFAFEDWFKRWFFQILQALEQMSVDPLAHPRNQAVMHLSNLLRDKPEQESNILRLLTNKLGDTQRSIASKTSHHLLQTLQTHPGMTPILVREVSALILHPRTSAPSQQPSTSSAPAAGHKRFGEDDDDEGEKPKKPKKKKDTVAEPPRDHARDNSRYYGVTTLNQVMLKKEQGEVAGKMVDVYFEVFNDVLGRLPDVESDGEGAANGEGEEEKKIAGKKRGRDEDKKGKKKGKKGGEERKDQVNDVDAKLVAAVLTGINRAFPFAKLDDEAFKRRLDTLFRITHTSTFNVSIQALMLIYHVSAAKKDIADRFYRALYNSLHDPRLTHSSKQALYLNLVFRATKADKDNARVAAFVKRLLQVLAGMETTFVLGALFVVGELIATTPGLRDLLSTSEAELHAGTSTVSAPASKSKKSAVEKAENKEGEKDESSAYDGKKRDPRFAGALKGCLWELTPLLHHYHPTVSLSAQTLLSGQPLSTSADLEQYTLAHFLDRFVYREAKKSASSKGSSMMQSGLSGQDTSGRVMKVRGGGRGEEAMNQDGFRRRNRHDVPVDQQFFHHYFTSLSSLSSSKSAAATRRKSRRAGEAASDDDDKSDSEASIADLGEKDPDSDDEDRLGEAMDALPEEEDGDEDEEFEMFDEEAGEGEGTDEEKEKEIWQAMIESMPTDGRDSDDEEDADLSFGDLEDAPSADEDESEGGEFDYEEDEEDRKVLEKIRRELEGATEGGQEEEEEGLLREDEMDELITFEGASGDEAAEEGDDDDEAEFVSAFPDEEEEDFAAEARNDTNEDDDGFLEEDDDVFGSDDDLDEDIRLGDAADEDQDEEDERERRKEERKSKRRKVKHLPTFASAEDYAHLLGGSDDEEQ
ncbi:hypothetical protein JCM11641_003139 [Rhodosporidiobolus odoratus]